jgi:hypothetical protein
LDCSRAQAQAQAQAQAEGEEEEEVAGKIQTVGDVIVPLTLSQALLGAATGSKRGLDVNRVRALMRYLGYAQSNLSPCHGPAHCQYTTLPPPLPSPSPSPSSVPSSLQLYVPVADRPRHHSSCSSSGLADAAAVDADGPSHRLPITGTWNANTGRVL